MQRSHVRRSCASSSLAALMLVIGLSACSSSTSLRGAVIEPAPDVNGLSLPDARSGMPVQLKPARGGVLLMYFGYTHCPDVCPTSLAHVKAALQRIGADDAARISLAFATVDPDRDTGSILQGYVRSFVANSAALRTTDAAELRQVADAFRADYSVTRDPNGGVEVSHTGTITAIDDTGHIAVQWTFNPDPKEAATIAHDLKILLARSSA